MRDLRDLRWGPGNRPNEIWGRSLYGTVSIQYRAIQGNWYYRRTFFDLWRPCERPTVPPKALIEIVEKRAKAKRA